MSEALAVSESRLPERAREMTVEEVIARVNKVHDVMKRAMKDGHHYGTIPGTPKPSLWKPGAELLSMMFRLDPQYVVTTERDETTDHLTITSTCTLWHIPSGERWGSGMGSCSSRESKYAFRTESRTCPKCGSTAIIKAKYGSGGWLCFAKKGGCGAKYPEADPAIMEQETGRVANEDIADQENTILKMANKRAQIAAVLNATAASDIFTQDLEDRQPPPPEDVLQPNGEKVELIDRAVILGKIKGAADAKLIPKARRAELLALHLGTTKPEMADIVALLKLLDAVRGEPKYDIPTV